MKEEVFEKRLWLSSPTMHGDEMAYIKEAYNSNWISTVGENIDEIERLACEKTGIKYAVALSCGTSALHMAVRLARERAYGSTAFDAGTCSGLKVFCSDMTFSATVYPVLYEGGIPVFIDSEYENWNMNPAALERAFEIYPNVRIVICANLYGTPAKLDELSEICRKYGALLIEDAAESLGASYKGKQTGTFGTYNVISFNGNKIITGSSGGMLLTDDEWAMRKVRKWSTQSREKAPWYQHEELGYNYRMSNVIAGVVRGQFAYLDEHIAKKKAIYERYWEGFKDLPVSMNPYDEGNSEPNFWLSCLLIDRDAMCRQVRSDNDACFVKEKGKTCPTEILETLAEYNVEGRPIWKPMHMQPMFRMHPFVMKHGDGRAKTNAYVSGEDAQTDACDREKETEALDVGADIFARGLCLPSDIKMTEEEQERVMAIVRRCFE